MRRMGGLHKEGRFTGKSPLKIQGMYRNSWRKFGVCCLQTAEGNGLIKTEGNAASETTAFLWKTWHRKPPEASGRGLHGGCLQRNSIMKEPGLVQAAKYQLCLLSTRPAFSPGGQEAMSALSQGCLERGCQALGLPQICHTSHLPSLSTHM